jgi:hypothetical protein
MGQIVYRSHVPSLGKHAAYSLLACGMVRKPVERCMMQRTGRVCLIYYESVFLGILLRRDEMISCT